jgi:hypothetical protein
MTPFWIGSFLGCLDARNEESLRLTLNRLLSVLLPGFDACVYVSLFPLPAFDMQKSGHGRVAHKLEPAPLARWHYALT